MPCQLRQFSKTEVSNSCALIIMYCGQKYSKYCSYWLKKYTFFMFQMALPKLKLVKNNFPLLMTHVHDSWLLKTFSWHRLRKPLSLHNLLWYSFSAFGLWSFSFSLKDLNVIRELSASFPTLISKILRFAQFSWILICNGF